MEKLPENFSISAYLFFNSDLNQNASYVELINHYLNHGINENRIYNCDSIDLNKELIEKNNNKNNNPNTNTNNNTNTNTNNNPIIQKNTIVVNKPKSRKNGMILG